MRILSILLFLTSMNALAQERVLEGKLKIQVSDHWGKSVTTYQLETDYGKIYPLLSSAKMKTRFRTGDRIAVKGNLSESGLTLLDQDPRLIQRVTPGRSETAVKSLYILVNFTDNKTEALKPKELVRVLFEIPRSVSQFYRESSFGQSKIEGKAVGVYTLPSASRDQCALDLWAEQALVAAKKDNVAVDDYPHRILIFPSRDGVSGVANSCAFHGLADFGGTTTWAFINHNSGFEWGPETTARVIAHEQGHNLGLGHAASRLCNHGATTLGTAEQCEDIAYGDSSDDMGSQYQQLNAIHKFKLGWIQPWQEKTITESGTYFVFTSDREIPNIQLLKIAKPDTKEFYYLSYRTNEGLINYGFGNGQGVFVHLWDASSWSDPRVLYLHPTLPLGGAMVDPLLDGEKFIDHINGVVVKQLRHDREKVELEIQIITKLQP